MNYSKIFLSLLTATALLLTGCTQKNNNDILTTIPSASAAAGRVNAGLVLENAGCSLKDNEWQLSDAVENLLAQSTSNYRAMTQNVIRLLPAVEGQSIYFFAYDREMILTCTLLHADAVAAALEKELGKPVKKDGFKIYDESVVLRDNQLWLTGDFDILKAALKDAAQAPAAASKPFASLADADGKAMAAVVNNKQLLAAMPYLGQAPGYPMLNKDRFGIYDVTLEGNTMRMECVSTEADGTVVSPSEMVNKIGPAFCRFIPADATAVVALGSPTKTFIDAIMDSQADEYRQQIEPFFKAWTGSFAVAYTAPSDYRRLLQRDALKLTVAVGYDEDKAKEIIDFVASNVPSTRTASGVSFNLNGLDFSLRYADGTLVGETNPTAVTQPVGADRFKGYACGFADINPKGDIATGLGLPFGIKLDFTADEGPTVTTLQLTGSKHPLLESLLILATDQSLQRKIAENIAALQQ